MAKKTRKKRTYNRLTDDMLEAAKSQLRRGVMLKDVAKDLGVSQSTITRRLNLAGLNATLIKKPKRKRGGSRTRPHKLERIAGLIATKEREITELRREAMAILTGKE